jgi:hypothetical protein
MTVTGRPRVLQSRSVGAAAGLGLGVRLARRSAAIPYRAMMIALSLVVHFKKAASESRPGRTPTRPRRPGPAIIIAVGQPVTVTR